MSTVNTIALGVAIAATLGSTPLMAYKTGDMILRAGAAGVFPAEESGHLDAVPGARVEGSDAWSLGITFTYMLSDRIGLGILGAYPFNHNLESNATLVSALGDNGNIGKTRQLPPTVTLQWHFPTVASSFHPYVGAGVNYTMFFDEDTRGPLNGVDLNVDNSLGLAGEAGLDYVMENDWILSAQAWYINIEPEARLRGGGLNEKFDIEIDPWVFMVGIGRIF